MKQITIEELMESFESNIEDKRRLKMDDIGNYLDDDIDCYWIGYCFAALNFGLITKEQFD